MFIICVFVTLVGLIALCILNEDSDKVRAIKKKKKYWQNYASKDTII